MQASTDIETILSSAIRELGRKLQASEAMITMNVIAEEKAQEQTEQPDEPFRASSNDQHNQAGGGNPPQPVVDGSEQQEVNE
jgi:hypothetical protein